MKVILITTEKSHHKVKSFDSVDDAYSWLFNSLPAFYDYDTMIKITSKLNFRDLFAYSDTVRLIQSESNAFPEYLTVIKLKS